MEDASVPRLPLGHYRLVFRAGQTARQSPYTGSAWRGALGRALRQLVCVTGEPRCGGCLLYSSCLYPYVFETPPPVAATKLRKYSQAPRPFVLTPLSPGGHIEENQRVELELGLFGHGNRHLPHLIHALAQAGPRGVGPQRQPFALEAVYQIHPAGEALIHRPGAALTPRPPTVPTVPAVPATVRIHLHTPLRLVKDERLVKPSGFHFSALFGNLLRRISLLTAFHTDHPLETDFAALTQAGRLHEKSQYIEWFRKISRRHVA